MSDVKISVRTNGPLLVEGNISLCDGDGNAFTLTEGKPIALCRCGHSKNNPMCDGSHKAEAFARKSKEAKESYYSGSFQHHVRSR